MAGRDEAELPVPHQDRAMAHIAPTDDILESLAAHTLASARFNDLPPSHRAEYVKWINEARKPETRARRISAMLERLSTESRNLAKAVAKGARG
jgi:uncharacterized protein YdeI (YjbR/CyaY-like superfamily)